MDALVSWLLVGTGVWCVAVGVAEWRKAGRGLLTVGAMNAAFGGYRLLSASTASWRVPGMIVLAAIWLAAVTQAVIDFRRRPPEQRRAVLRATGPLLWFAGSTIAGLVAIELLTDFTPLGQSRRAVTSLLIGAGLLVLLATAHGFRVARRTSHVARST